MSSPPLPPPRGPLSESLVAHWTGGGPPGIDVAPGIDPLIDDDLHLALWCCYQLHYRGFDGIEDEREWDLATLALRDRLERSFESALRAEHLPDLLPDEPAAALRVIETWDTPPLSVSLETDGTIEQLREFAVHRSAYQLKEADPHTWAIPRLTGPGRSAMIEIQADEYGRGSPGQSHAELYAAALTELGLCPDLGHDIDRLPGVTLATDNLVSMFGLHRRLRGALVGHLALFEMCSVAPMTRYLTAAQRFGDLPALERFYEVHTEVDGRHGALALDHLVAGVVTSEPHLAAEVIFGAAALSRVEARFARHVLGSWAEGRSSLRTAADARGVALGEADRRTA